MSDVERYYAGNIDKDRLVILAKDYDAAKSELAALREELAAVSQVNTQLVEQLRSEREDLAVTEEMLRKANAGLIEWRLLMTAAEQRNAEAEKLLRRSMDMLEQALAWELPNEIYSFLKPTESGASDTSKPPIGSSVLVCGGIKAIVKAHHADGLVVGAGAGYVVNEWSKP